MFYIECLSKPIRSLLMRFNRKNEGYIMYSKKTNVRPSKGDYGAYLQNRPKTIYWTVVTPKSYKLSVLEDHDLIFDNHDCKIRRIENMF